MRPTILIVEDHVQVRTLLKDWLSPIFSGCEFLEAATGEAAVTLASDRLPEMVLMDIKLPQMDGIEATRRIKAISPQSRVVMLTICEAFDYQAAASAAGADAYVPKRTMHSELVPVMNKLFSQSPGACRGNRSACHSENSISPDGNMRQVGNSRRS